MIKLAQILKESEEELNLKYKVDALEDSLTSKYPEIQDLHLYIGANNALTLGMIRIKPEFRKQGIGSKVVGEIKKFADDHNLTILLTPEPEWGYKKKLDKFYKGHGFVNNKGRNRDYRLSGLGGPTMFRRPKNGQ